MYNKLVEKLSSKELYDVSKQVLIWLGTIALCNLVISVILGLFGSSEFIQTLAKTFELLADISLSLASLYVSVVGSALFIVAVWGDINVNIVKKEDVQVEEN